MAIKLSQEQISALKNPSALEANNPTTILLEKGGFIRKELTGYEICRKGKKLPKN